MDIPRPSVARQKRIRRTIFAVAGLLVLVLVTVGLAQVEARGADRGARVGVARHRQAWLDAAPGARPRHARSRRHPLDSRGHRGPGGADLTLPGTIVEPDTEILELSDERVQQEALDAEYLLRAAEADLASVRVRLQNELLQQQSAAADIQAQFHRARITAEANEQLSKEGLQSAVTTQISRVEADELENRNRIEQERLKIRGDSARRSSPRSRRGSAQRRALYELRRSQIDALKVRAGIAGVLQVVPVEVGQRVAVGANLARVAAPGRLKAELRIPETQAKDLEVGLKAVIDTRNGEVEGRVARVDPASQNGTVLVDVSFTGRCPGEHGRT